MKWNSFFIGLVLLTISPLYAKIGCIDNSDHLKHLYDTKTYHFVHCLCPCRRIMTFKRNQCTDCKHYHDPAQWIVIEKTAGNANHPSKEKIQPVDQIIHTLVRNYQSRKAYAQ